MDWKKFTSRKFWLAVTEFVSMLIVAFGGTESEATRVAALIMAGAGVVAYIVGEGLVDAASAGAPVTLEVTEEDDLYPFEDGEENVTEE